MRVEFLKARARALRNHEEVSLTIEDQRRTLVSLEKTALEWDRREGTAPQLKESPITAEGAACYAAERASFERELRTHFNDLWTKTPETGPRTQSTMRGSEANVASTDVDLGIEHDNDGEDEDDGLHFAVTGNDDDDMDLGFDSGFEDDDGDGADDDDE